MNVLSKARSRSAQRPLKLWTIYDKIAKHTHVWAHLSLRMCVYLSLSLCVCVYMCVGGWVRVCVCVCVCVCVYVCERERERELMAVYLGWELQEDLDDLVLLHFNLQRAQSTYVD